MGRKPYIPEVEKYNSEYNTTHFTCNNCPAKVYSIETDNIIKKGIGNINSGTIIVYPTYVSANKKRFNELTKIIRDNYRDAYGVDILDTIYITPSIKCFCDNINTGVINSIYERCAIKTISEIINHNCHRCIIFLGDAKDIKALLPNDNFVIREVKCPYSIFTDIADRAKFINDLITYI